jgi:hypothetical protein
METVAFTGRRLSTLPARNLPLRLLIGTPINGLHSDDADRGQARGTGVGDWKEIAGVSGSELLDALEVIARMDQEEPKQDVKSWPW